MNKNSKIFIAGHNGLLGTALTKLLKKKGFTNLILKNKKELDLRNQCAVNDFFQKEQPEYIFLLAAKVGGIYANRTYKADFLYDNLQIQNNVIRASWKFNVKKLLFTSCSCIYPKKSSQPMKEEFLLSGMLEPTNEPFAIAKLAGIKLCESYADQFNANFISAIFASLFGPNDNFDELNSHFVPALIRKFHNAKLNQEKAVVLWGTGTPKRELMYVDDAAEACLFLMNNYDSPKPINVGLNRDWSVKDIANKIKEIVGFEGDVVFDKSKPDGMKRKLLDSSKLFQMGWSPKYNIYRALKRTYDWYLENLTDGRAR